MSKDKGESTFGVNEVKSTMWHLFRNFKAFLQTYLQLIYVKLRIIVCVILNCLNKPCNFKEYHNSKCFKKSSVDTKCAKYHKDPLCTFIYLFIYIFFHSSYVLGFSCSILRKIFHSLRMALIMALSWPTRPIKMTKLNYNNGSQPWLSLEQS